MPGGPPSESEYEFAPQPEAVKPPAPAPLPRGAPAPDALAPDALEAQRICPHCGFRMVTKPVRGRCPECAAALDEVATDLLQFADRRWVIGISNGSLLLAASILPHVAASVMAWSVSHAEAMNHEDVGTHAGWWTVNLVHALGGLAGAIGVWMAAAPEPGLGVVRTPMAPFAKLAAAAVTLLWVLPIVPGLNSRLNASEPFTEAVLLMMAVQIILVSMHLKVLAARVPNDSLGAHLTNGGFLTAAICVILAALHFFGATDPKQNYLMLGFFCAFPMIGLMALVLLWTAWSLIRLALELRSCAAAGEHIVAPGAASQAAQAKRA